MSFTATIGIIDSEPGNIVPGLSAIVSNISIVTVTTGGFSDRLGDVSSMLGNIVLGSSGAGGVTTQIVTATMNQGIGFGQLVSSKSFDQFVNQTLALSQLASGHNNNPQEVVTQTLTLTQLATGVKSGLTQHINQVLGLTDLAHTVGPQLVSQSLPFTQSVVTHGTLNKSVSQVFSLVQTLVGRDTTVQEAVTDMMAYTQSVAVYKLKELNEILAFNQSVAAQKNIIRSFADTLSIVQTVTKTSIYNLSVSQTLKLVQGMPISLPFIGQNFFTPTGYQPTQQYTYVPPQVVVTVVNSKNRYVLFATPTQAIKLRTPELGDNQEYNGSISLKRSMNNVLFTYVRRAKTNLLKYNFYLGRQIALALEDFLANHSSEIMYLYDWKGQVWIGNIVNNPFDFVTAARYLNESERVDVVIEFSGIKVAG